MHIAPQNADRSTLRISYALGCALGLVAVLALEGCSGPPGGDPSGSSSSSPENVGVQRSATIDDSADASYLAHCKTLQVPAPPNWGTNNIGTGKAWTSRGHYDDTFIAGIPGGDIYTSSSTSPPGLCVINAHGAKNVADLFDVICQGSNGEACFWEGWQMPQPVPANVAIIGGSWTPVAQHPSPVTRGALASNTCTNCHAGQNAFIAHYSTTTAHPLNLTGTANWMPSKWYDPVTGTGTDQNPGPDPMAGYPASTTGCTNCHQYGGGSGGAFPRLSTNDFGIGFKGYCRILQAVTNRPGTSGGMPPGNTCMPNVNCAAQTDPFVQAMLSTCNGVAWAGANSPVAFEGYSTTTPYVGFWDHAMVDKGLGTTSHQVDLLDNFYHYNEFQGWSPTDETSTLNTNFRTTMWLKGSSGANLAMAATNPNGDIWEVVAAGGRRKVTANSPMYSVGSPSAYTRHDGYNTIVFRGGDSYIYESYWNSSAGAWSTNPLPGQTQTAQGDPIGYNRGSSSSVIYKCGLQVLCEERLVNGTWYFRTFTTIIGMRPFVPQPLQTTYNGAHTIFYTGDDGVHAVVDPCEPWYSCTLTDTLIYADPSIVSAPIPYTDQANGTSVVFISDQGGTKPSSLVQLSATAGSGWSASTLVTADKSVETLVGDPAAYIAPAPWENTILFRNSAGALYQLRWDYPTNQYRKTAITF